jgi:membrane-associated protease RseP (regulator of RpoE activity)
MRLRRFQRRADLTIILLALGVMCAGLGVGLGGSRAGLGLLSRSPLSAAQPGSPAQEAGLRPGDLIHEVNRRPVRSAREFSEAVRQQRDKDLVLLVNRRGSTAFVVVERSAKG